MWRLWRFLPRCRETDSLFSSGVSVSLEVEEELQHAAVEDALPAVSRVLGPLAPDDLEADVLVRRAGVEADEAVVGVVCLLDLVGGDNGLVDQIRIKDVELVAFDNLGRRVLLVVVSRVVSVPVVGGLDAVEEARLSRPVLVVPQVGLRRKRDCGVEGLLHGVLGVLIIVIRTKVRSLVFVGVAAGACRAVGEAAKASVEDLALQGLAFSGSASPFGIFGGLAYSLSGLLEQLGVLDRVDHRQHAERGVTQALAF